MHSQSRKIQLRVLAFLAAAAPTAMGCTFVINLGYLQPGNNVICNARVYESNNPDLHSDNGDKATDIPCGGGCTKLNYKGETYQFCYDGAAGSNIRGDATVQRVSNGGGVKVNIHPDGKEKDFDSSEYISSGIDHYFYQSNIACP